MAIEKCDDDKYQYTLLFTAIRDADQDLVVRAALHAQTRQLKKRQQENNQQDS